MSDVDEITLGDGCVGVKDVVDTINNTLDLVGEVCDDTTLGTRAQDLGNLTNDTLDLVSDVDEVTLGDGCVGVKNVVDAINNTLDLVGEVCDNATLSTRGQDLGNLTNNPLDLVSDVDEVTLGLVGMKDVVDAINNTL